MWALDNRTPYACERGFVRDGQGAEIWVVAIKASFTIEPGGALRLAERQEPVREGPLPHVGLESLRYESDFGPPKAATDVLLVGSAHAPAGRTCTELDVGLRVGPLTRTARIFGERRWRPGLLGARPGAAEPFARMPLVYERACGGAGTDNPVGVAPEAPHLPNIEDPLQPLRRRGQRPPPLGFGPVAEHWPTRQRLAGTYDDGWMQTRYPLAPLDFDPGFWQIAPRAQQLPDLHGGESVTLLHLAPLELAPGGRLDLILPRLRLGLQTRFFDGPIEHGRPRLHSLILEPDQARLALVYHYALPCHERVNQLAQTRIVEKIEPWAANRAGDA